MTNELVMKYIQGHLDFWIQRCIDLNKDMEVTHHWLKQKTELYQEACKKMDGLPEDIRREIHSFYEWKDTYEIYNIRINVIDLAVFLRNEKYEIYFVDCFRDMDNILIYHRETGQLIERYEDTKLADLFEILERYHC